MTACARAMASSNLPCARRSAALGLVIAVHELEHERGRDTGETVGVVGLLLQHLLEQAARVDHGRRRRRPIEHGLAAQDQIGDLGAVRPLAQAAPRLDVDDLEADGARDPGDDLVLNLQDRAARGVEALGPELASIARVDQPDVDAHPLPIHDHAAFEQIAHVELTSDLPRVGAAALVRKGGVARDDGGSGQGTGEIADEAVGDPIGHVVLLAVAAEIDERQHDDRGHGHRARFRRSRIGSGRSQVSGIGCDLQRGRRQQPPAGNRQ